MRPNQIDVQTEGLGLFFQALSANSNVQSAT